MTEINKITAALREFRDERDWAQFHNPKDIAIALSVEASGLPEVFLWKFAEEAELGRVKEELADVFAFAFLLAGRHELDVQQIAHGKIVKNRLKYPVEKAKSSARKYNEL